MENLVIKGDNIAPEVYFNPNTGELKIEGKSLHENPLGYFRPMLAWVQEYSFEPAPRTIVKIYLQHFNTASTKCLISFLEKLQKIAETGNEVIVNWHYEADDDDMQEAGEDLSHLYRIPFKFIAE